MLRDITADGNFVGAQKLQYEQKEETGQNGCW